MSELFNGHQTEPIELTEQELANISGGFDFVLSIGLFEQSEGYSSQENGLSTQSARTSFSGIQIACTGLQSINDVIAIFEAVAGWLQRR
jgi:bacteriocin-like protein